MKSNILFTVTNNDIIPKLKEKGITNLVYPLSFFCVGVKNTFNIEDIKEENSYLLINRVLDSKSADKLNEILHNLSNNIKGIIFDDIGIIEMLKDVNIEKILFNTHFTCNYESINYLLDYVDSLIPSTDLTYEEYEVISRKSKKKLTFFTFGLISGMYSRRTLLNSHNKHYGLNLKDDMNLNVMDKNFLALQNEYGTVIYHMPYYNGLKLKNINAKYYFYFPILLDNEKVSNIAEDNLNDIDTDEGFLNTKTIYKVKRSV